MPACPQKGRALQLAHYVKDKLYATTLAVLWLFLCVAFIKNLRSQVICVWVLL